jgi:hypothetical protein
MEETNYNQEQLDTLKESAATKLDISNILVAFKKLQKEVIDNFNFALGKTKEEFDKNLMFHKEIDETTNLFSKKTESAINALKENLSSVNTRNEKFSSSLDKLNSQISSTISSVEESKTQIKSNFSEFVKFSDFTKTTFDNQDKKVENQAKQINELTERQNKSEKNITIINNEIIGIIKRIVDIEEKQFSNHEEFKLFVQENIEKFKILENDIKLLKEDSIKTNYRIDKSFDQINKIDLMFKDFDSKNTGFHNEMFLKFVRYSRILKVIVGIGVIMIGMLVYLFIR